MNKKTLITTIIIMTLGLLLVAGFSIAYFSAKVFGNTKANNTVIETDTLRIVFTDTQVLSMEGIIPGQSVAKTFTVENRGTKKLTYTISIEDLVNTFVNNELIYSLVSDSGINIVDAVPTVENEAILTTTNIEPGVTQTYTFTLTFKETGSNQNSNMGAIFSGKLQINSEDQYRYTNGLDIIALYVDDKKVSELEEGKYYSLDEEKSYCENGETVEWDILSKSITITPIEKDTKCKLFFNEKYFTLTEKILADNNEQSDVGISFANTSASDGTNGLYYTSDTSKTENGEVVYYYRGAVTNNYLVFGNYCWRIVRTVEDGSVRLRYGGSPTQNGETYTCPQTGEAVNIGSSVYNESYNNKSYVNYKTSDIRTTVENWYRDNIWKNGANTKVTNLIADTPYCNDISYRTETEYDDGYGAWLDVSYFGAYDRLVDNKSPQYKCEDSTYGYTVAKGDLTYPIALITADEVAYAGGVVLEGNTSYYLNTGEDYWTMSPCRFLGSTAFVFNVHLDGYLSHYFVGDSAAAVPAISLKPEAAVKRGTGAYNDPYIILTE